MRRYAIDIALAVSCIACESPVTRQYVVSPAEAAAYGSRATVVTVERYGNVQRLARGVIDAQGRFITTPGATLTVGSADRVTVDVTYRVGDEIADEGVLETHPSVATILIGGAAILAGGAVMIIGVCGVGDDCHTRRSYGCTDCFTDFDKAEKEFFFLLAGGGVALGGIITAIIGAIPKNIIVKPARVNITPVVAKGSAGAALQIRF